MKPLELIPALDIKVGQVTQIMTESVEAQRDAQITINNFKSNGIKWIHLVDLDQAYGSGNNHLHIAHLIKFSDMNVQLSGGIRNEESLVVAINSKAKRINLATSSLIDPEWVKRVIQIHGDRISVSLDVMGEDLIDRGSGVVIGTFESQIDLLNRISCSYLIITDNSTEGTLRGPNISLIEKVKYQSKAAIIASGGVSALSDLSVLRNLEIEAVIVGKALYTGHIKLEEAIEVCYK